MSRRIIHLEERKYSETLMHTVRKQGNHGAEWHKCVIGTAK